MATIQNTTENPIKQLEFAIKYYKKNNKDNWLEI